MGTGTPGVRPADEPGRAPLSRRARRVRLVVLVLGLVGATAVLAWSATDPTGFDHSRHGCVTVNVASTMGGLSRRSCGDQARTLCAAASTRSDPVSLLTRRECVAAGLTG